MEISDKQFMLEQVNQDGGALKHAGFLKGDKEVVLAAVHQLGDALYFVSYELRKDKEVVLAAVNQDGGALMYSSEGLAGDKEVVLVAVNQNGNALEFASEELKGDKKVVMAAVNQSGVALHFASEELQGDKGVVLAAVKQIGFALKYASEELRGDKEVVLAVVSQDGDALMYASHVLQEGGFRTYLENLLDAYTVPSSVFLGTVVCSIKSPSVLPLDDVAAHGAAADSVVEVENEKDGVARIAHLSRTEANICLLSKLDLGDDTTVVLVKKIAAFAGVQCQEVCTVPWSQVVAAARYLKVETQGGGNLR